MVDAIRRVAGKNHRCKVDHRRSLDPGLIADKVAKKYRKILFGEATLQDLPDRPRFVLNATNIQTGALWRFSKPYMGDYRVGRIFSPTVELATAVAASSAFPPVLSPLRLQLDPSAFRPDPKADLQKPPYTETAYLSDGGVYDNMGIETAWKRYKNVLVSDAGGKMQPDSSPKTDWPQHVLRILGVIDNQVRSLRKRQVVSSYVDHARGGAYWGIRSDIAHYEVADALPCPVDRTLLLAKTPTRLKSLPAERQEQLINWGYAVCDAAMRKHVDSALPTPSDFPYPSTGV